MTPKRIQLRRAKGWRKPEGAVVVARPTKWGNPFPVGHVASVEAYTNPMSQAKLVEIDAHLAVMLFRAWLAYWPGRVADVRLHLADRDLACWCPLDQPCHADVLLEIANGGDA